jgi:pyruvate formate-lyase/glycerol dehydratase family glycyl radical enzyme
MSKVTLEDVSLRHCQLTPRVRQLRESFFGAMPEVCVERAQMVTRCHLEQGLFDQDSISILDKARVYRRMLTDRRPVVRHTRAFGRDGRYFEVDDRSLFAGATTSKFIGVPVYPEFLGSTLWPELWQLPTRQANPFQITEEEVRVLNEEVFPRWMGHNITELTRKRCWEENLARSGVERSAPQLGLLEQLVFFLAGKVECISMTIPDFQRVLSEGLRGIIQEAEQRAEAAASAKAELFYRAMVEALEGIVAYSENLADEAIRLALVETDSARRHELLQLAQIHRQVPAGPARSFREGLTAIWVCWNALYLENVNVGMSLGRFDQLLYPLYSQDVQGGVLTVEGAVELLCCWWLKIGDHVPCVPETAEKLFGGATSNQAITIGGVDEQGRDAVNDLTYAILRAVALMKVRDPSPNARYFQGVNSRRYLRQLCAVNLETGAIPAIFNDRAVIRALSAAGEPPEHARDYGIIGCVIPSAQGRSYGNPGAIYLNLPSVLELTLFDGRHRHTGLQRIISPPTGDPRRMRSFEEFEAAFEAQARWLLEQALALNEQLGQTHQRHYPTPILSALMQGPMECGKDLVEGGAQSNSTGISLVGIADVADSLSAIEALVFDQRRASVTELLEAIQDDFRGHEELLARLRDPQRTPRFGNENPAADANLTWILELFQRALAGRVSYRGGGYRVGCWTLTMHAGFGRLMQAMPSGRRARANFASGITPVSGMTPHLTGALNSVAGIPPELLANGMALNLKYTPQSEDPGRLLDSFVASVEGYCDESDPGRRGGLELQFNVTSRQTLLDAMQNPEAHDRLLVRVSGYTAFFRDLEEQMQREIIERSEYDLASGRAASHEPLPLWGSH